MNSNVIVTVLSLVSLIALVGVAYPFKPFRRRSRALFTLIGAFILIAVFQPDRANERTGKADKDRVSSSNLTDDAGKQRLSTADRASEGKLADVADKAQQDILDAIQRSDWNGARRMIRELDPRKFDTSELLTKVEEAALAVVRPLPASDFIANETGYRFLASVAPQNQQYIQKAEQYARRRLEAQERARSAAISKLRKKFDKVEKITWYHHPNAPKHINSRSTVYLYIGRRNGGEPWLRMQIQYAARDWLFVNKVEAWHDGIKETLYVGQFERDHYTTIWEWVDVDPTDLQIEILRSLGSAKEAILRFHGQQYRRDVTLSSRDKIALREMLKAFEAMNQ